MSDSHNTETQLETASSEGQSTPDGNAVQRVNVAPMAGVNAAPNAMAVIGDEAMRLNLPLGQEAKIRSDAARVLSHCVPPQHGPFQIVVLAHGLVQSGKTANFITASALARDNDFQLVIVLAGSSISLMNQTRKRLDGPKGLNLAQRSDRQWLHVEHQIKGGPADILRIQSELNEWRDPSVPRGEKKTVIITLMKHHRHIASL